jgi:hypothetical protein
MRGAIEKKNSVAKDCNLQCPPKYTPSRAENEQELNSVKVNTAKSFPLIPLTNPIGGPNYTPPHTENEQELNRVKVKSAKTFCPTNEPGTPRSYSSTHRKLGGVEQSKSEKRKNICPTKNRTQYPEILLLHTQKMSKSVEQNTENFCRTKASNPPPPPKRPHCVPQVTLKA